MVDYGEEVRLGPEILARVVEAYRKLRNTSRILLANLYDFDPATDLVVPELLEEVDRYALARYGETAQRIVRAYDAFDFPTIFQSLNTLATVDLSAFYVDVTKDRMYTFAAKSPGRRSAQTVMYLMADGLARLLAPILPVTADQMWHFLPGSRSASVHLEDFPDVDRFVDPDLLVTWGRLMQVRNQVNAALEETRKNKVIGNSVGARVTITATGPLGQLLQKYLADLPMFFIVSDVTLQIGPMDAAEDVRVTVEKAPGIKCDRCWRYVKSVRSEPEWAGLCDRCVDALPETVSA